MGASAIERLGQLREDVEAAKGRVRELEARRLSVQRSVERAKAPLRDYHEQLGAGEREPDPKLERKLLKAVTDAESRVTTRPIFSQGQMQGIQVVDERLEAELAGASRALDEREAAVEEFARSRLAEIAAERLPRSRIVGERYRAAVEALIAADGAWIDEEGWWMTLGSAAGAFGPDEIPARPLELPGQPFVEYHQRRRDPVELVPAPRWLTKDE
jgi:hypothetical protein